MITVGVAAGDYALTSGAERVKTWRAPILYSEPAYESYFCGDCGSPVPPVEVDGDFVEIPAGLFDHDPGIRPDKHIFVELIPDWDQIDDGLPTYTMRELYRLRSNKDLPADFEMRTHRDPHTD